MARPSGRSEFNESLVRKLARLLEETGLTEIEYGRDGWHVRVARSPATEPAPRASPTPSEPPLPPPPAPPESNALVVTSPMVGVVYVAAEPEAPPLVKVGDEVKAGQTLLLIEAMKVFNPITAPRAGRVVNILVSNGAPVEYDEPLLVLE